MPTTLYSDSKSPIVLMKDGHYHACTKHIDICYYFIQYIIEAETIKLIYCPTDKIAADILTKALSNVKAKNFAATLGLCVIWKRKSCFETQLGLIKDCDFREVWGSVKVLFGCIANHGVIQKWSCLWVIVSIVLSKMIELQAVVCIVCWLMYKVNW